MKITTMLVFKLVLSLFFILGYVQTGFAQAPTSPSRSASSTGPESNPHPDDLTERTLDAPPKEAVRSQYLSSFEFIITIMVVLIGLIALAMEFIMLRKIPELKAEEVLRVFAVTLIIIGTLFFITAGFNSKQIAPAMGLFGTVAGYLLGKSLDRKEDKENE